MDIHFHAFSDRNLGLVADAEEAFNFVGCVFRAEDEDVCRGEWSSLDDVDVRVGALRESGKGLEGGGDGVESLLGFGGNKVDSAEPAAVERLAFDCFGEG